MSILFENQTVTVTTTPERNLGGPVYVQYGGTLGTASLQPQISINGFPFQDFGDPFIIASAKKIELPNCEFRFVYTAGGSSDMSLTTDVVLNTIA